MTRPLKYPSIRPLARNSNACVVPIAAGLASTNSRSVLAASSDRIAATSPVSIPAGIEPPSSTRAISAAARMSRYFDVLTMDASAASTAPASSATGNVTKVWRKLESPLPRIEISRIASASTPTTTAAMP